MSDWFRSSDMLPPFRIRVRVLWKGRIFEATRTAHPTKKRADPVWVTFANGEMVILPPKGRARSWGNNPDIWQPIDPTDWDFDLPRPTPEQPDISWHSHGLPAEMARPDVDDWWRDASQIRYSERGQISEREAEGRVMRAICTGWTINVGAPQMSTNAAVIARLSETKSQLAGEFDHDSGQFIDANADWRPPFQPTGQDRDDFLLSMTWFTALNPPELRHKERMTGHLNRSQRVLCGRAMDPPLSWVFLGGREQVSDERIRQVYQQSVERVWRAANGMPVFKHVTPIDQIEALRGRNRAHATKG
jgi:hypothetical protein